MNFLSIIKKQRSFDKKHGFNLKTRSNREKYNKISRELIGFIGETGEFANLVKKINLSLDNDKPITNLKEKESLMQEELIDVFIYWIRLCDLLKVNVTKAYSNKLKLNQKKYSAYKK